MSNLNQKYDEAVALAREDQLEEAVSKLKEIVAEEEQYKLAHSALAIYLQKLNRLDDAIEHAKKVVEIDPQDVFSYTQLSIICQRCGRIEEAEEAKARAQSMG